MRVLLVEDDASVANSIVTMLRSEGFVVDTTDLGEDGLEIGKIYDYDIILLDLMLPDSRNMNSLEQLQNTIAGNLQESLNPVRTVELARQNGSSKQKFG